MPSVMKALRLYQQREEVWTIVTKAVVQAKSTSRCALKC